MIAQELEREVQIDVKPQGVSEMIDKTWELTPQYRRKNFRLSDYRPVYLIPLKWSDRPNRQPIGLNPNRPIPEYKDYDNVEAKFQVSLKSKIIRGLFNGKGDIWVGFTQVSYWQVYAQRLSRPFRETNYEPEVMFIYPVRFSWGDFKMKMVGLSLNHESNGKEEVYSRSWNRVILMTSFEYKNWVMNAHIWGRLSEKEDMDDNPYIEDYIGRGNIQLIYNPSKNRFLSITHRNNFSLRKNRSYTEISLVHNILGSFNGFFQISHGYGESLIDYNHKQTIFSVGIAFADF